MSAKQAATQRLVMIQICMKEIGNPEANTYTLDAGLGYQIMADGPERPPTVYYVVEVPEAEVVRVLAHLTASEYVHGAYVKSSRDVPLAQPAAPKDLVTIYITVVTGGYAEGHAYAIEQKTGLKLWANGPERPPTRDYTTEVEKSEVAAAIARIMATGNAEKANTMPNVGV